MIDENIIPKDWKIKTLGEVCEKVETVKRKEKNIEEKFVYLDIGGIDNSLNKILHHKDYSWKDAPSRAQQIVFRNDILFSTVRTYMKNIALVDNIHYHGQIASSGFCVIRGNKNIVNHKFIFYLTLSNHFLQPLNALQTGSSYPAVRDKDVFSQQIPLPPLAEQEKIVSKIEELFSELDKSIENLRTAQQQLKTYRQAVLKWAFEGKLTEAWRKKNGTRVRVPTEDRSKDVKGALPDGWEIKRLNEIGTWRGGGTPSKARNDFWEDGNILWVSPKDMKSKLIHDTIDKITLDAIENSSTKLIPKGSVLFVVRSGILRRTLPVALTITDVTVNQDIQAFTPYAVLPDYVYWFIKGKSEEIRRECSKDGTTVESIESSLLKNYTIPISSPEEQCLIVQEIESRLSVTDKLEETIKQSLQQAEALRQSILKKAFEGKLE